VELAGVGPSDDDRAEADSAIAFFDNLLFTVNFQLNQFG
jgi:hypothetical protein